MGALTSFRRIVRAGVVGFFRNGFVSAAAVLIMTVTLFVMGALILLFVLLNASLAQLKEKVDITVYFVPDAPEEAVRAFRDKVAALPEVAEVQLRTRDEALAAFVARHQDDPTTLQALEELGENPLGASLTIRARDPSLYPHVASFLKKETPSLVGDEGSALIDRINYDQPELQQAIARLTAIIRTAERFGLAATVVLVLASTLIVFTTMRLAIYSARDEIAVMRLVGASDAFIRAPFVVEGALAGAAAGLLAMALLWPVALVVGRGTSEFFGSVDLSAYYLTNAGILLATLVGSGVFLGALASYLAVKRYLSV